VVDCLPAHVMEGLVVTQIHRLLLSALSALCAGLPSLLVADDATAQTRFASCFNFGGIYEGSYDGRNARIFIETHGVSPRGCRFFLRFIDSGGQAWCMNLRRDETPAHILRNVVLRSERGSGDVNWKAIYLHTWDINFLSGVSVWNGTEFGMSFRRTGQIAQVSCSFNE
jgi:hypothetical protein